MNCSPRVSYPRKAFATQVLRELVPALPVPRRTRVLVVGCGVKIHFPWDLAKDRYDRACAAVSAALDDQCF